MNTVTLERVTLYYREGTSDKVYQAAIDPAGSQFVVNFAYGRRGATLTTGTKTSSPVDYAAAQKIYAKLVGEKKAKGYTEGEDGTPYQHMDNRSPVSGCWLSQSFRNESRVTTSPCLNPNRSAPMQIHCPAWWPAARPCV